MPLAPAPKAPGPLEDDDLLEVVRALARLAAKRQRAAAHPPAGAAPTDARRPLRPL